MAFNLQTTTYGDIADILGYDGAGVLGRQLGHIMFFCAQNKLPPLTVLVVNSDTGLPGEGLETKKDLHKVRYPVFHKGKYQTNMPIRLAPKPTKCSMTAIPLGIEPTTDFTLESEIRPHIVALGGNRIGMVSNRDNRNT